MAKKPKETVDFEQSLQRLEALVERLEKGELTLEETLAQFETGMGLAGECQRALEQAEQKVRILLDKRAEGQGVDFEPGDE